MSSRYVFFLLGIMIAASFAIAGTAQNVSAIGPAYEQCSPVYTTLSLTPFGNFFSGFRFVQSLDLDLGEVDLGALDLGEEDLGDVEVNVGEDISVERCTLDIDVTGCRTGITESTTCEVKTCRCCESEAEARSVCDCKTGTSTTPFPPTIGPR
jgi:hypothetical protein